MTWILLATNSLTSLPTRSQLCWAITRLLLRVVLLMAMMKTEAGNDNSGNDNTADDKDDIDLGLDSSGEERCAQSLYTTKTAILHPAQGWQSHSQMNRLASC
jgi:hypothetical protein